MRLRKKKNLNRGLISDAKHERLKQPDRGLNSVIQKWQQKQTNNNKTPHQYLKKGGKARTFCCLRNTRHWFKIAFVSLFSRNIDYIKHPFDMYIFVL